MTEDADTGVGVTGLTACLTGGGVRTEAWVYGDTTAGGIEVDSNNVVGTTGGRTR